MCLLQERSCHADHFAVRIAFRFYQRIGVLHCRANAGITKQFLQNTNRRTGCIQPCAKRVTERVPTDRLESEFLVNTTNMVLLTFQENQCTLTWSGSVRMVGKYLNEDAINLTGYVQVFNEYSTNLATNQRTSSTSTFMGRCAKRKTCSRNHSLVWRRRVCV